MTKARFRELLRAYPLCGTKMGIIRFLSKSKQAIVHVKTDFLKTV